MREISKCQCGKRKSKYACECKDCAEEKHRLYKIKIDAIRTALVNGRVFSLNTYLGELEVNGINPEGEWAYTGSNWTRRSWAICSNEIERWYHQL